MSAIVPSAPASGRRHDLDWLRVFAFALLIFYHVGMFYVTWGWHVKSDHASHLVEPAMRLVNPWRLALLFFISGVALRYAFDARGVRRLLPERTARLLVPLAFGMLVWVVPQAYLEMCFKGEFSGSILEFYPRYLGFGEDFSIITPTWNHLWYVAYVFVYTLALAALLPLLSAIETRFGGRIARLLDRRPFAILLIALPFLAYHLLLAPHFPTTHAMIDDWANHANSFSILLVGWYAARSDAFWRAVDRTWRPVAIAVLVLGAASVAAYLNRATLRTIDGVPEALGLLRVVYAWCAILVLLALSRRWFSWSSPALAYMSEAVFSWYILHQTITVAIGYAVIGAGLPAWLEVSVVLSVTIGGCLVLHELVIRRSRWLRPLFGMKAVSSGASAHSAASFAIAKKPV